MPDKQWQVDAPEPVSRHVAATLAAWVQLRQGCPVLCAMHEARLVPCPGVTGHMQVKSKVVHQ